MIPAILRSIAILFLSKFVILEVIDIIFGEHVELGGLVEVIILVIALIAAQKLAVLVWRRLGDPASEADRAMLEE